MTALGDKVNIDWQKVMAPDSPAAELEIVASSPPVSTHPSAAHANTYHRSEGGDDGSAAEFASFSDEKLQDAINRWRGKTQWLSVPDGGEKLRKRVDRMKKELERRKVDRQRKDETLCKQAMHAKTNSGSSNDPFAFNPDDMLSNTVGKYTKITSSKSPTMTNIQDRGEVNPLSEDRHDCLKKNSRMAITSAGHQRKTRAHHQRSTDDEHLNMYRHNRKRSALRTSISNPQKNSTVNLKGKQSNFLEENTTCCSERRWSLSKDKASSSFKFRKDVVLLDEDDDTEPARLVDVGISHKWDESKIYYPSRTDPEAVELTYSDMKCLEPEEYLKSPVINFCLQYLKKSRSRKDLYMFNTYFYSKLEEALSATDDCDSQFSKLRRWWRSVDIFKQAYIILPINEMMHWSLIIVCMPAKDREEGPIMLHLDSLGLHSSQKLFNTVASYLEAEWRHLQKDPSYDIPFSGAIWKRLSRNINREKVEVPRQRNEYDCGLFMLYYVDRFIQEAPERLRRDNLGMFGRKWFNHEEASRLREGIRALLFDLFQSEQEDDEPAGAESQTGDHSDGEEDMDDETVMNTMPDSNQVTNERHGTFRV